MQPTRMAVGQEAADLENQLALDWRVTHLTSLGIPRPMAEVNADNVDWQQIASLVGAAAPRCWPCRSFAEPWPGNAALTSPGPHPRLDEVTSPAGSDIGSAPDRSWRRGGLRLPGRSSCTPRPRRSRRATSSPPTCSMAPRPMSWP